MSSPEIRALVLVGGIAAALYLPFLGARDLWAPDEPRHAQVAQEMVAGGHWWQPHVNGRPYPDKPHLYFWLAALSSLPRGHVTEASARLPAALAGVVVALLLCDLGRLVHSVAAGRVAGVAVATAWLPAWLSRRVSLDALLCACVVLSAWCAWRAVAAARGGRTGAACTWSAALGAGVALGLMTKGPVALLPVAAAVVALVAHAAPSRPSARAAAACAATAVLACAGVLAAWLVPAHALGGYDPFAVLREHVVDRSLAGRDHAQGPWYYLIAVPADFMPWTLLLLPAAWAAWRGGVRASAARAMGLAWLVLPVLVLSLVVEKRNVYALPVMPAAALLVGVWVADQDGAGVVSRGLRGAITIAAALGLVLGAGALAAALAGPALGIEEDTWALPGVRPGLLGIGLAALGGAALLGSALGRWRDRAAPLALALAVSTAAVEVGVFALLPAMNPVKSARGMGEAIATHAASGPLAAFPHEGGSAWDAYVHYGGRSLDELPDQAALWTWLQAVPRPAHVLTREAEIDRLPLDAFSLPRPVATARVGHRSVVLVRYERLASSAPWITP
jgi:4-amino-4-deoxy-L-arabinose transferase-like glycosyltransferase